MRGDLDARLARRLLFTRDRDGEVLGFVEEQILLLRAARFALRGEELSRERVHPLLQQIALGANDAELAEQRFVSITERLVRIEQRLALREPGFACVLALRELFAKAPEFFFVLFVCAHAR